MRGLDKTLRPACVPIRPSEYIFAAVWSELPRDAPISPLADGGVEVHSDIDARHTTHHWVGETKLGGWSSGM